MTPFLAVNVLAPNAGLFFWTLIIFLLLLFILKKYAWTPIAKALDKRELTIEESILRAERALEEARQISADNERARREADVEAQRLLVEAREASEKLRDDEVQRTQERIRKMQEQAQTEIERQKQGAIEELRSEVATLALQAAEKILRENLDADRHRRLVDEFIQDLPKN